MQTQEPTDTEASIDPKAGERAYYAEIGADGIEHSRQKPFSDINCGKYLFDLGALFHLLEPAPRSILDFGCGAGWTSILLARAGYEVLGIDISEQAITIARESALEQGVARVEFATADYEEFRASKAYDYVLFYDALHHADNEMKALEAAYRALRPGGILFAFEPGAGHRTSAGAQKASSTYHVHEKDMPPRYIWKLSKKVGFRRRMYLPTPHRAGKGLYRRDYLRAGTAGRALFERGYGYYRSLMAVLTAARSGIIVMWK